MATKGRVRRERWFVLPQRLPRYRRPGIADSPVRRGWRLYWALPTRGAAWARVEDDHPGSAAGNSGRTAAVFLSAPAAQKWHDWCAPRASPKACRLVSFRPRSTAARERYRTDGSKRRSSACNGRAGAALERVARRNARDRRRNGRRAPTVFRSSAARKREKGWLDAERDLGGQAAVSSSGADRTLRRA